ncbi:MAG TPA: glycoside hydrolase family 127 protein [Flavitalea sp.]|nr:glycoside hydrolase family 127 protein [Flavitalea sp.]
MKKMITAAMAVFCFNAFAQQDYPIKAVPFTQVQLTDNFWLPRLEKNRTITIPASFEQCRITGRIRNFEMAATRSGAFCTAYPFDDTDIYKTIEGASYTLSQHPDASLTLYLDSLISLIGKAQEPDGYLYTARTINPTNIKDSRVGKERWEKEQEHSHELYNAGHLYEAAVAHFLATGKKNLLDIAIKNADLIDKVFGPGKRQVAPGHEVIEMGLVKLYRATGEKRYLNLAKFFLDQRGRKKYDVRSKDVFKNGAYWQDHKPVTEQDEATGHAVRAMYLYAAMADIAAITGDTLYLKAIDRIWENMSGKKVYLHGGIGAAGDGERFGDNYDLPNLTAYSETCAAIGSIFWNQRMFQLHGDAKYIDLLEKTLYNGMLSGVGLDGKSFFYTNAMEVRSHFNHPDLEISRAGWFVCSCCPTNVTRMIPSIPGYIYATIKNDVFVNLYISSSASIFTGKNNKLSIVQETQYPWNGSVKLLLKQPPSSPFRLFCRIPGWARNEAVAGDLYTFSDTSVRPIRILINGKEIPYKIEKGYAIIERIWKSNDSITLSFPMEVRQVRANKSVKDDLGKVALQCGPIIYCAEWVDNSGKTNNLFLPGRPTFIKEYRSDLLNGVMTLKTEAKAVEINQQGTEIHTVQQPLIAIPYYSWAHRGKGEMKIWLPVKIEAVDLISGLRE